LDNTDGDLADERESQSGLEALQLLAFHLCQEGRDAEAESALRALGKKYRCAHDLARRCLSRAATCGRKAGLTACTAWLAMDTHVRCDIAGANACTLLIVAWSSRSCGTCAQAELRGAVLQPAVGNADQRPRRQQQTRAHTGRSIATAHAGSDAGV
jgi:hypothetical protein